MIALGEWFVQSGFMVLENESRIVIARGIHSGERWALLRLSKLPGGVEFEWKLLRTCVSQEAAQRGLDALEEGMWREGFNTEPSCAESSPYANVPGFGAF